jgi:hypothetical protein
VTAWLVAVAVAAVAAIVAVAAAVSARRRAATREARRVEELRRLAERLEASLAELRPQRPRTAETASGAATSPAPLVADRLPGRAALLEAVGREVAEARSTGERLTAVVVRVADETSPARLADAIRVAAGRPAYAVGPGAAAFTLPTLGRAEGLGVLARIESATPSSGHAVEWATHESAAELVTRLLESRPRSPGDRTR